jgi:hypothetical protein
MTRHTYRCMKVVIIAGICAISAVGCAGSGDSAQDKKQRLLIQGQINQNLTSARGADGTSKFMCMRLPSIGPDVILVANNPKEATTANKLLRHYKINGSVEIKTPDEYFTALGSLAERVASERPKTKIFKAVHIINYLAAENLLCPRVDIELGLRGQVSFQVIAWARSISARYGSDRVEYGYGYGQLGESEGGPVTVYRRPWPPPRDRGQ